MSSEQIFFQALQVLSWNLRSLLSLWLKSSVSCNIRHFFRVGFFHFLSSESCFLKYKKVRFPEWNIGNFFGVSISQNIKKAFFWENIKNFVILEPESSISRNIRKCKNFFYFSSLGLKTALGSYFCKTFHRRCLTVFWIWFRFWIYHGSEDDSNSKYARVLKIPFPKYRKKFRFLKIRKAFFQKR